MAFFRIQSATSSGSAIQSRGICYATHENPTVDDNIHAATLSNSGIIYWLKDLQTGTKYYVRAWAKDKEGNIGYSDQLKMYTLPKSNISYYLRTSDDADADARIKAAADKALDYWSALTSISGFNSSIGYASGTPTADCSYGGWMRVGPNTSYQRCGTIMHEWLHGIGVGTHSFWWNSDIRSNGDRGDWLGDRATELLRFWDNSSTEVLTGDATHLWPYGINGAHEDNGTDILYIGTSLVAQAICEDGLPPTYGFALPAYVFEQEDTVKYYLKSESADRGKNTSYLFDEDGSLKWKEAVIADISDSAAWYVTYEPSTGYYRFKNAATGRYISYSNGFKLAEKESPASSENIHLMKGRVDVAGSIRGYYLITTTATSNPPTLTAMANGKTGSSSWDVANSATTLRWMILTADEAKAVEETAETSASEQLTERLAWLRALLETPHIEDVEGKDATFSAVLDGIEEEAKNNSSATNLENLIDSANTAALDFLAGVTPSDTLRPFDISYMILDAGMSSIEAWTAEKDVEPTLSYSCAEFYEKTFNFYQTVKNLPIGTYQLKVQGFQRPGSTDNVYTEYLEGTNNVTTRLFMGVRTTKLKNIIEDASDTSLGGSEKQVGSKYVPNNMYAASKYFDAGLYDNGLWYDVRGTGRKIKLGISCSTSKSMYWTIFDNFRLYFYGQMEYSKLSGVKEVTADDNTGIKRVFSIDGRYLGDGEETINSLPKGVYVIGGRKVVIK